MPELRLDALVARRRGSAFCSLPPSTIYGFNGTFPGPRINAEYGKPALVRFLNQLDQNPLNLDRQDFGSPDWSFLTHLHNGHTAPESDGNPHYCMQYEPKTHGYLPQTSCDNLYLNWPAGNDDREKQSFFWFHDHRMDHTGANVYKGLVGLYPIYDPVNDTGDEPLFVTGLSVTGPAATDFSIASDGCSGAPVGPGATCWLGLRFTPAAARAATVNDLPLIPTMKLKGLPTAAQTARTASRSGRPGAISTSAPAASKA